MLKDRNLRWCGGLGGSRLRIRLLFLSAFSLLAAGLLRAQERQDIFGTGSQSTAVKSAVAPQQFPSVPMESTIDPQRYIVGPSDVISVGIWGPNPSALSMSSIPLVVTPEGTLIVPTVGEIRVAGLSLADAKDKVSQAVKKRYLQGDITVTLLSPRTFLVNVSGAVLNQGSYIASPIERVDKLVIQASRVYQPSSTVTIQANPKEGEQTVSQSPFNDPRRNQVAQIMRDVSTRNILLKRRDGKTYHVDIPLYYATKDDRYNPFLLDGDVVFIPRKDIEKNFVSIYGAVNSPGQYEFVTDDSLTRIVKIAQGYTELADLEDVVVSRLSEDGNRTNEIHLSLDSILQGKEADFPLQRGDRISIKERLDLRRDYKVYVSGEVKHPGYVLINRQSTRLSKVIEDAGGFTEYASMPEAIILRGEENIPNVTPDFAYARTLRSMDQFSPDSLYFLLSSKLNYRPVVADFRRLFTARDSTQDITILDRDVIFVPSSRNTVYVDGQVENPGHIPFVAGQKLGDYIKKAGGYSEKADEGETRVIKGKTLEWTKPEDATIESGDRIYVPRKPPRNFGYYFTIVRDILGVATGVATITLLYIQITK
jgi:protein involved in polysaccharide export with SLBB domain